MNDLEKRLIVLNNIYNENNKINKFNSNLICCGNCEKFYDCSEIIVERKMGKGICKNWKYDNETYLERNN